MYIIIKYKCIDIPTLTSKSGKIRNDSRINRKEKLFYVCGEMRNDLRRNKKRKLILCVQRNKKGFKKKKRKLILCVWRNEKGVKKKQKKKRLFYIWRKMRKDT